MYIYLNIGALQYVRQILTAIKRGIDSNIIIVGNSNIPLTSMDNVSSRKKINKETQALNYTLHQIDLIDIYTEHSIQKQKNTHSFQVHMELFPG